MNLTREQIAALTGQALDEAVARRVLGWDVLPDPNRRRGVEVRKAGDPRSYPHDLPEFSRLVAPAWDVVEAMRARNLSAHIDNKNNGHAWTVQFNPGYLAPWEDGVGDTMPLAVCRAALLALCGEGPTPVTTTPAADPPTVADRRGPAGGCCGNCGGAIP